MKTWKKLTALAMAFGLVAGFVACGGKGNDNSGSSSSAPDTSSSSSVATEPEALGEAEMEAAIEQLYSETNFTVSMMIKSEDDNGSVITINNALQVADGKAYMERTVSGTTEYVYIAEESGVWYEYSSFDNETWYKDEMIELGGVSPISAQSLFGSAMNLAVYSYYDFVGGENVFTNVGAPELRVTVVGGKIVGYKVLDTIGGEPNQVVEQATISCGNASVGDLPTVEE